MTFSGPSREALIQRVREAGERVQREIGAMDAASMERGVHENGWNARQLLAHMASIEWTYPRLIDLARPAAEPKAAPAQAPAAAPSASPQREGGAPQPAILGYNDRQVAKRAEASVAELLEEFARNRAATLDAIASADDALLATEVQSAGGLRGTLARVYEMLAVDHVLGHLQEITDSRP